MIKAQQEWVLAKIKKDKKENFFIEFIKNIGKNNKLVDKGGAYIYVPKIH